MRRSKPITSRPVGVGIRMRRTGAAAVVEEVVQPVQPVVLGITDIDYLLIVADWYVANPGAILGEIFQLRARLIEPVDSGMVGWSACLPYKYPPFSSDANAYIYYGGNCNNIPEAFWVNLYQIWQAYPDSTVRVELYGKWYADPGDGLVDLSVSGIRNGLLGDTGNCVLYSRNGHSRGSIVTQYTVPTSARDCEIDGDLLCTVSYDGETLSILTPSPI